MTDFENAISINPIKTKAYICKGNILRHLERFNEAINYFNIAYEKSEKEY